jgi:hypothetical protein
MAETGDRIKTPDQWTQTIGDYNSQSTVEEKDGKKFVRLKHPPQLQGRRILLDVNKSGVTRGPSPPFRVEYKLINPSAIFDDSSIVGLADYHTGLTIPEGSQNKGISFSYVLENGIRREARVLWKMSEDQVGVIDGLVIELNEPDVTSALNAGDRIISTVADYICFSKEVPLEVHNVKVFEASTNELVRVYLGLPYSTKVVVDERLLDGGLKVPKQLVPLLRLFRDAINSINPYYRMMCLYRIAEGLKKIRALNEEKVAQCGSGLKRPRQRIPDNEFTRSRFSNWIGKSVHDFVDHVEHNFRRYNAHLIIDESLNFVPDTGTTLHAQETDQINSMLVSIVRQLIVDEWTFMQANDIT